MQPVSSRPSQARRSATRAFTLIELLTVIAIIGILAAIIIPTVGAVKSKARTLQCASKLREWGNAVRLFANDNKGNVPLLLNLSGDPSLQFYNSYFPKMKDFEGGSGIQATDFWTICPSVSRTVSDDSTRRNYNFISPNGKKTAPQGSNVFGTGSIGKAVDYYNLTAPRAPSQLILMLEQLPGSDAPIQASDYINSITTKVKPILINNTDRSLVRHNGIVNVLYLDGSTRARRLSDLEFKPGTGTTTQNDPRFSL